MGKSLKKRFIIVSFIVLPVLFVIGAVIALYVCDLFIPEEVMIKNRTIILMGYLPLYLVCVFNLYRKAKARSDVW